MTRWAPWAAAAVGVQVGATIVATRVVVDQLGPATLAALRYAIGLVSLLPFVWYALRREAAAGASTPRIRASELPRIVLLGIGPLLLLHAFLYVRLQSV